MLKEFDERIRELFDEHKIDYARVFARSSNIFYQNYDLYVKKDQALIIHLLVPKAKQEVDYENPKWYRNIVFDETALKTLAELFPERKIKTEYDAVKLVEELEDNALNELQKRMKEKGLNLLIRSKLLPIILLLELPLPAFSSLAQLSLERLRSLSHLKFLPMGDPCLSCT
jgi:hypothetical protein